MQTVSLPNIRRHLRIIAQMMKTSTQAQAQYRIDFLMQIFLAGFWAIWHIAPLWIIFELRPTVAGWTRPQAMLVMSAFLMLKAMIEGLIMPNLDQLVEGIRSGTFDFILLKPADAQVMISFSKILPAKLVDFAAGVGLSIWSIAVLEPAPSALAIFCGALMLIAGALAIYALWLMVICTAFWWVKVDNLSFLFTSVFDAARWPITVFRGWIRTVLTFVVPVAIMTSFPAMAILGRLSLEAGLGAWALAGTMLIVSRIVWRRALRTYASASS
ncbi:MAG: ABC-2 family transporter protein [Myxococcota bacterium]